MVESGRRDGLLIVVGVHGTAAHPGMALRAEPGDVLSIDGTGMSGLPRTGTIIAVAGQDGTPPYLVRWTAGDYESRISPGPGARIEKHCE